MVAVSLPRALAVAWAGSRPSRHQSQCMLRHIPAAIVGVDILSRRPEISVTAATEPGARAARPYELVRSSTCHAAGPPVPGVVPTGTGESGHGFLRSWHESDAGPAGSGSHLGEDDHVTSESLEP